MTNIKLFQDKKIRSAWNEEEEQWYFSVVDVVAALTDSRNPIDYLKKMRKRDEALGSFIGTNCPQVEMLTEKGKKRKTLSAIVKSLFRIIQSIPSPKAEPFKQWLAQVGYERLLVTTEISQQEDLESFEESRQIARRGGNVAGVARKETEKELGRSVSNPNNYLPHQGALEIEESHD